MGRNKRRRNEQSELEDAWGGVSTTGRVERPSDSKSKTGKGDGGSRRIGAQVENQRRVDEVGKDVSERTGGHKKKKRRKGGKGGGEEVKDNVLEDPLDDIFGKLKAKKAQNEDKKKLAGSKTEAQHQPKVVGNKDDIFGENVGQTRKKTEEGFNIYTEDELQMNVEGGGTELCPFDCDCCF